MVPLSFQPYAESEKQNNLFHQLKREVTFEGFCYDAREKLAASISYRGLC